MNIHHNAATSVYFFLLFTLNVHNFTLAFVWAKKKAIVGIFFIEVYVKVKMDKRITRGIWPRNKNK